MPGYLRRLAQQSGLLASARPRPSAGAEAADIQEIHEERVIGGGAPAAPSAQEREGGERPVPAYEDGGAAPFSRRHSALASAGPKLLSPAPERAPLQAPPHARASDPPPGALDRREPRQGVRESLPAPSASILDRGAGQASARDTNRAGGFGPPTPQALASPDTPARATTSGSAEPPRAAHAPVAAPRSNENVHARTSVVHQDAETATPRRSIAAEPAPAPRRVPPAARARESSVRVHIGRINVEIRAPEPRPAVTSLVAAPGHAPSMSSAPAPAERPFSPYRHYLRS
jgi:hypothetical protein